MRISLAMVVVAMVCLLGDAEQALAWGPATHIGLGAGILSQLGLLPPAVAAILLRHRVSYLYGNIAADVVFAKRLSRVKQFCHHWSTAFGLLDAAEDDAGRAFAYGYLSHLAADTVAHGKYVPHQIMVSGGSVNLGHFYWEIRADVTQDDDVWQSLERTMVHDHDHHHEYLKGHMSDTFLPYLLNRRLFHGMNMLAAGRRFRRGVAVWNRCSRWYLSPTLLAGYQSSGAATTTCFSDNHAWALLGEPLQFRDGPWLQDHRGIGTHSQIYAQKLPVCQIRRYCYDPRWRQQARVSLWPSSTPGVAGYCRKRIPGAARQTLVASARSHHTLERAC